MKLNLGRGWPALTVLGNCRGIQPGGHMSESRLSVDKSGMNIGGREAVVRLQVKQMLETVKGESCIAGYKTF